MLESITKLKAPQKANVLCFNITCPIYNTWDILGFPITKELLFDSTMAAELSTIPVSMGGDADNTRLVELDQQGYGVLGSMGVTCMLMMDYGSGGDSVEGDG